LPEDRQNNTNLDEAILGGKYRYNNTKKCCNYIFKEYWQIPKSLQITLEPFISDVVLLSLKFFPICPKGVHRSYFSSSRMFLIYFLGNINKSEELMSCTV